MSTQQTPQTEEEFSYPPFKPVKSSLIVSLFLELIVFAVVASVVATALISGIEFVEENTDKLLIRLIVTLVVAVAASIVAGILFRNFKRKKQKAEWETARARAKEEFLRVQQEQKRQAENEMKRKKEQEEFDKKFNICEFCNGPLTRTIDEHEVYSTFVKTDYTVTKTGYNEYNVKQNGFNAKRLNGKRKISCPKCGYQIVSDFEATNVGGQFGYSRKYLSTQIYPDVNSSVTKEQLQNGRLCKNLSELP